MKNLEWVKGKKYTEIEAWILAGLMMKSDYIYDSYASSRAGYPIYMSTSVSAPNDRICDLGSRLEVNVGNESFNIWLLSEDDIMDALRARTK